MAAYGAKTASPSDVAQALVSEWVIGKQGTSAAPTSSRPEVNQESDLTDYAARRVRAAMKSSSLRRYGPSKIFIASVWEQLKHEPEFAALDDAQFKQLLVTAHQRGALTLTRADLVAAMDPADVSASETRHLNAIYHFIQDSGDP
jgi:hypothetical protein